MAFLTEAANRGSIPTGYEIDNSLKLESDNSEYLKAEGRPAGNQQVWTWSCWLKRTEVNNGVIAQYMFSAGSDGKLGLYFRDDSSSTGGDTIFIYVDQGNSLKFIGELRVSFRDTSAWYHIVFAVDSTDGTPADRTKIYVNGVQQTITFNDTLNQNSNTRIGDSGGKLSIGAKMDGSYEFNGYMAEVVLVDGSQLTPTSFGEFDDDSGVWKPKDVSSLSLGNAGFYMNFDDSSNLGKVQTGTNQGNFDLYNITSADQATDTPTNNFAIPNVIGTTRANAFTYTEGGTKVIHNGGSDWNSWANTMAVGSGKWYAEFKIIGGNSHFVGVGSEDYYFVGAGNGTGFPEIYYGYSGTNSVGYHNTNGDIYNNGTQVVIGTTYTTNDIISVALDMDNGKVYFAKNGTYINSQNPATGANSIALPDTSARYFIGTSHYTSNIGAECNYGGYTSFSIASAASDANDYGTFEYAPPSGYYALCSKNLAEFG